MSALLSSDSFKRTLSVCYWSCNASDTHSTMRQRCTDSLLKASLMSVTSLALHRRSPTALARGLGGGAQGKTKSDLTVHSCRGLWFQKHNCLLNIIPESGCEVGGVHILPPQTGFSTNHKLLLFLSSCLKMKYLMRKGSRSYFQGV